MAITAVELLEYSPGQPWSACSVGDRWGVSVDATNNLFSIFDATTETARAFTGIQTFPAQLIPRPVESYGGYAWTIGRTSTSVSLIKIDPSSGGTVSWGIGSTYNANAPASFCWAGGQVWVSLPSSSTTVGVWTLTPGATPALRATVTTTGAFVSLIASGGVVYMVGTAARFDATTGTRLTDLPAAMWHPGAAFLAVEHTGILWAGINLSGKIEWWDIAAAAGGTINPGFYHPDSRPVLGPDGLLYFASTSNLVIVNPTDKSSRTESFTTSRAQRTTGFAAAGALYFPSGAPL